MVRVAVLVADGFEEVEAITPIDFLRRAAVDVTVVGVTGRTVTGGHGIRVEADVLLSEVSDDFADSLDAVLVPGGEPGALNIAASPAAMDIVTAVMDSGRIVAAICAAPAVVLGGHDLIRGRMFTCYPGFETRVNDGQFRSERVVVDGSLITSRGPGTAAEFALEVIRHLVGVEVSRNLRQQTLQPA